jgi:hypothetical protein
MNSIEQILALLGPATLLPIRHGQTKPMISDWQNFSQVQMQNPAYRFQLNLASAKAVLLGGSSSGLVVVTLYDSQWVELFLEANPKISQTLQTKLSRESTFWLRIVGEFPPIKAIFHPTLKEAGGEPLKIGEFRATGCEMICGDVNGLRCYTVVNKPPLELSFAEIVWPELDATVPIPDVAKPDAAETTPAVPDLSPSDGLDPREGENPNPPASVTDPSACPARPEDLGRRESIFRMHPVQPHGMDAEEPEAPIVKSKRRGGTPQDLNALIPMETPIAKKLLIQHWKDRYGNHAKGRKYLDELIADGKLFEWQIPRTRTNALKLISRIPQPTGLNLDNFQKTFQTPDQ